MDTRLLFYTSVKVGETFGHLGWGEYNWKETCNLRVLTEFTDEPTTIFLVLVCSFPIMFNSVKF